jgi:tetratricopeptide (TPR) repeat protein
LVEAIASYLPAAELSTDRQLLLETARAYRRLGDVDGNPNGPNLGNPARALEHYGRAMAVLDRLRSLSPGDDIEFAAAQTLTSRGDVEALQLQYDRATGSYDRALALVTQLSARHPDDARYQELAAGIHRPRGDLHLARGDVGAAVEEFERALAFEQVLAARFPGRPDLKRLHALTQIRLGDARATAGALDAARTHYENAFGTLSTLAGETWYRRNLIRDGALGLARLGTLLARSEEGGGQSDLLGAIAMLRDLNRSDPSDARARRDLMVALTQYADVLGPDDAARTEALNEALQLARLAAVEPAGGPPPPSARREMSAIAERLANGGANRVSLQLIDGRSDTGPIQAGRTALHIGDTVRAVATSPPGWSRYLLVFGAEGPAELIDEATLARTNWAVPIKGPGVSQTVLLLTTARELTADERRTLAESIAAVAGPRVIDFDSHILWNDATDRIESVATARGDRDTRWVEEVQTRIAALGNVRLTGRTFPIAEEFGR